MDETRIDAQLPQLNIEVVRRDYPDGRAEVMTIKMTATPSFKAVGGMLTQGLTGPMAGSVAGLWAAPMLAWAGMMQAAWAPFLGALAPRISTATDTIAPQVTDRSSKPGPGGS